KIVEAKDIRLISETERIEYNHTSAPWPVKDRDFVFRATVTMDRPKKQLLVHMQSVKDSLMPETSKNVSGEISEGNDVLTSIDNGTKTNLMVEIHADPKGSIPKWIVNLFQKSWPAHTLEGIQKQCAKADVLEMASVKKYFDETPAAAAAPS